MKKTLSLASLVLALGVLAGYVGAQVDAQSYWIARLNWMSGAALNFIQRTNSNGQLITYNNTTGDNAVTIDDATGGVILRSRTSTQLGTQAPSAAGELMFNSSANTLCISSGTGPGAYIMIVSTVAAGNVVTGEAGTQRRCW